MSVSEGMGSSARAQRRRPGGVTNEEEEDRLDDEADWVSSNMSSSMLTISGTNRMIDG